MPLVLYEINTIQFPTDGYPRARRPRAFGWDLREDNSWRKAIRSVTLLRSQAELIPHSE
jgi:hypothetical protein